MTMQGGPPAAEPPLIGHIVECNVCHARTVIFDAVNVHDALNCECCPGDHKHADEKGVTQNPHRSVTIDAQAVVIPSGVSG